MSGRMRDALARALPDAPRRRYCVQAGTNDWSEWRRVLRSLLADADGAHAIRAYEAAAAQRCGTRHAVAFGAGRMGLYAILAALDLAPGDEIVLPAFTCAVVANAMVYRGAVPVFADIDPMTFNIDPRAVASAVTARTRAIYLQHTFGVSCDVEALTALAQRHGLLLIEDAAHSLGALHRRRAHGGLGDVGFFSTDRTKVINTALGGCVTTNDDALAGRLRALQQQAVKLDASTTRRILATFIAEFLWRAPELYWLGRPILGALRRASLLYYWNDEALDALPPGYPYPCQFTGPQADLGLAQLARLDENLAHRRRIARWLEERVHWYGEALGEVFDEQAWLRYSFLVADRDAFVRRFGAKIDLGIWFPTVLYGRETSAGAVGYRAGSCPVAERVARHIVNLPTHPRIPLALYEGLWARHGDWLQSSLLRIPLEVQGHPAVRNEARRGEAAVSMGDAASVRGLS